MSMKALVQVTKTPAETERFAAKFAKGLKPGAILLLIGELGSGKTTFVKGLAKGLGISQEVLIHSPSFTLINEYPGKIPLYHVDLYRLDHLREIEELGLEDYLQKKGVVAVEWADRAEKLWPSEAVTVRFKMLPSHQREIGISFGPDREK
jgi:tRNA threonylcarbamoyladenosine biosynthesis protein TsaE